MRTSVGISNYLYGHKRYYTKCGKFNSGKRKGNIKIIIYLFQYNILLLQMQLAQMTNNKREHVLLKYNFIYVFLILHILHITQQTNIKFKNLQYLNILTYNYFTMLIIYLFRTD